MFRKEAIIKKTEGFNQINYINDYNRKHYKKITISINLLETEVLEKLNGVENKSKYIVDLIKKDIEQK